MKVSIAFMYIIVVKYDALTIINNIFISPDIMQYNFQKLGQQYNFNSNSDCVGCISALNANQLYGFRQQAKILQIAQIPNNGMFLDADMLQIIKSIVCHLNSYQNIAHHLLIGKKVERTGSEYIKNKLLSKCNNYKSINQVKRKFTNLANKQSIYSYRFMQGYSFNKQEKDVLSQIIKKYIKDRVYPQEQMKQIHQGIRITFVPIVDNNQSKAHKGQYVIRIGLQLEKLSKYMFYIQNKLFPQSITTNSQQVKEQDLYKMIHDKHKYHQEQKIIEKHKCIQPLKLMDSNEKQNQLVLPQSARIIFNETKDEIMKKHRKFLILQGKEDMIKKFQQMKINIQILQLPLEQKRKKNLYFYFKQKSDQKKLYSLIKGIDEKIKWDRITKTIKIQGKNNPQTKIFKIERQANIQKHRYRYDKCLNKDTNHYFEYKNQQQSAVVAVHLHDKKIIPQFFEEKEKKNN